MGFKASIAKVTGIRKEKIPSSYQFVGNVMLLKFLKADEKEKKLIAKAILKTMPYVKTVCETKGIKGELRKPSVKKIAGNGTETIHKEHGILYKFDAKKIMFSKGNHAERTRLIGKINPNEILLDMFAGIGYFSLNLAKFTEARKVYAIEKNPASYNYLKENIELNGIKKIIPIKGDCRRFSLGTMKVDRIVLGYFPGTEKYLTYAKRLIKKGGIIHFHNTYRRKELWHKPLQDLEALGRITILDKKIVKSVAPHVYHVVLDVEIS